MPEFFYGEGLFCQAAGDHRKPLSLGHSLQNRVGAVADPFGTDMDAPVLQFRSELFPGAAARFPQHKGLAFQVCHGDLCPAAERMPLGTDQHQFVPEHRAGEKIRLGHIALYQPEVQFTGEDLFLDDPGVVHQHLYGVRWVLRLEPGYQRRQYTAAHGDGGAHPEGPVPGGIVQVPFHLLK